MLVFLFLLLLVIICFVLLIYLFTDKKMPQIVRFDEEKYFKDPCSELPVKKPFPSLLSDPASVELSVIIPSYNEEKRLPIMLDKCIAYLEDQLRSYPGKSYEIIVVDDGSQDATTEVALNYVKKLGVEKMRVLTLIKNRGKGGAVRMGMLSARGKFLLFADADGATKFSDIGKLFYHMERGCGRIAEYSVIVGSRAHLEKQAIATRSAFRTLLMFGFHALVWLFGVREVRDTQCGFKLFTRKAAALLFTSLHVEGWAFDVELLYIAEQFNMRISEVAVNWTEIEGSKLVPFWSWVEMGKDLVLIWLKYQTGLWVIDFKKKET